MKIYVGLAFIISVAIHCLTFNTFIIVFPVKPPPLNPNLIFVGSILSPQDLIIPFKAAIKEKSKSENLKIYNPIDLSLEQSKNQYSGKPSIQNSISEKAKITPRSMFPIEQRKRQSPIQGKTIEEPQPQPYKSLNYKNIF